MENQKINRIMFAGTNSGCGKTTIVCGIIKALMNRKMKVSSFKCGPDYIDPMFHSEIIGVGSSNLDLFFCSENTTKYLFANNAKGSDIAVIEGVMGLYDGISGKTQIASSNHLSKTLGANTILIVDAKGASLSIAAEIKGFMEFAENNICGVILNNISAGSYLMYKSIIEDNLHIKVYGFMPHTEAVLESRHLGLITAKEVENLNEKIDILAHTAEKYIDIDGIIEVASNCCDVVWENIEINSVANGTKIAVAMDKAFCFYYKDNLNLLEKMGCEICYFSPIKDNKLPEGISGIIIGGGYPELYMESISKNKSMLISLKNAILSGVPTIAECGGFMLLHSHIKVDETHVYQGVDVVSGTSVMAKKLSRFGYITLTAQKDGMLLKRGDKVCAHEFHYSDSDNCGEDFLAEKPNSTRSWNAIHSDKTLFAGYPHIHLWSNLECANAYVNSCVKYEKEKQKND